MKNVGREGGDGKDKMKDPLTSMNIQRQGQKERFDNPKQMPRKVQVKETTQYIKLLQMACWG